MRTPSEMMAINELMDDIELVDKWLKKHEHELLFKDKYSKRFDVLETMAMDKSRYKRACQRRLEQLLNNQS